MKRPWVLADALKLDDRGFNKSQIAWYFGIPAADCGHRLATAQASRNKNRGQRSFVTFRCQDCRRMADDRPGFRLCAPCREHAAALPAYFA